MKTVTENAAEDDMAPGGTTPRPAWSKNPRPAAEPRVFGGPPPRPAWIEVDLGRLAGNFERIARDKPAGLRLCSVLKDDGYGHGAYQVARAARRHGATFFAISTIEEAVALRDAGISLPLLILGDRQESELPWCLAYGLTICLSEPHIAKAYARLAAREGRRVPVHLKINTGMNRYGVRWTDAAALAEVITSSKSLELEGALSHFAQSDETDKTFANTQLARFNEALAAMAFRGITVKLRHICNSGGFLDLAHAHLDMARLGILPLGIYPSSVCRRIPGLEQVMAVKARVAAIQELRPGDTVGYGMRFTATSPRRIAVLPIGYGDGFPRVRNQGFALVGGKRAPLVGGVAMDALTVDITEIPEARLWDEAVLMGRQGEDEITVHDVAKLKNSVSYDVLTSLRARLPRVYLNENAIA
jgi:alanine racemase